MGSLMAQGRAQGTHTTTCLKTFVVFVSLSLRHRNHFVAFCVFCVADLLAGSGDRASPHTHTRARVTRLGAPASKYEGSNLNETG